MPRGCQLVRDVLIGQSQQQLYTTQTGIPKMKLSFKQFMKKIQTTIKKADDAIYGDLYALSNGDITQAEYDKRQNKKK